MGLTARRAIERTGRDRIRPPSRRVTSRMLQGLVIAACAVTLFVLVWLYTAGLRDARYLDGWVLATGMMLQIAFHTAVRSGGLTPRSMAKWRTLHILLGYLLIAAFLSHVDFSWPETGLEWALWTGFVMVALSGVFGTYLAWSLKGRRGLDAGLTLENLSARRTELARQAHAIATEPDARAQRLGLPAPAYDAWILDFYASHLQDFFEGPRNALSHCAGSQHALKKLLHEAEQLSRYVDADAETKLERLSELITEKDRLDFARVHLGLTKGWMFVHVPVTYGLVVLSVAHITVVYAFSSGAW